MLGRIMRAPRSPSAAGGDPIAALPEGARDDLLRIAVARRWRTGQALLRAGEVAGSAFLVTRGRVRLRAHSAEGREQTFGWIEPGMFGALAPALAGEPSPCDFVAEVPSEALHFDRRRLDALLQRDGRTALALVRLLSRRVNATMGMLTARAFSPLSDRIRATLRHLARHTGTVVITQAELAHAVGGSRYRVGLELARLRAAGRIAVARGRITVLDVGPEPPARVRRAGARGQR